MGIKFGSGIMIKLVVKTEFLGCALSIILNSKARKTNLNQ
jgi:hypothetical protein